MATERKTLEALVDNEPDSSHKTSLVSSAGVYKAIHKLMSSESMSSEPTQRELTEAFKKLWDALGGKYVSIALFSLISFFSYGEDVARTNRWDEIKPTITMGEVMDSATRWETNAIASKTYVDTHVGGVDTNTVRKLIDASFVGGTNAVATTNYVNEKINPLMITNRYALFIVNINPGSSTNVIFRDIELKGTTNNFNSTEESIPMVYFTATAHNENPEYEIEGENVDWCRIYVLSYAATNDVRKWVRIKNTADSISASAKELAILIEPSATMMRRGQGYKWCYEKNDDLIWSYVRYKATGEAEMYQDGIHQLWRPIMPIRWYRELPSWANQTAKE